MKFVRLILVKPWALIRSPTDMEVLRVLCGTTRPLTGREVSRLVRTGSQSTVNATLRRLDREGVVRAKEAGKAYLYTLNRQHLAASAIEDLADIRGKLERQLRRQVAGWAIAPEHVSIFGSAARGNGNTRSDIDVFVVRPTAVSEEDPGWRLQMQELSDLVYAWTGNQVGLAEISATDVRRLRREQPPVVAELRRDAITITGRTPVELLGASA